MRRSKFYRELNEIDWDLTSVIFHFVIVFFSRFRFVFEQSTHVPPKAIPIIDIFAGPGGLNEGFSRLFEFARGSISFQTRLAIEKDPVAAETLTLRSFFRQFDRRSVPDDYYKVIRQELPVSALERFPEWAAVHYKVWNVELGTVEEGKLHTRITLSALIRFAETTRRLSHCRRSQ